MRAALLFSAALIVAPAAYAQNAQLQLRGVSADTDVTVGQAHDVGATALATGNAATAVNDNADATRTNDQRMEGDATATTDATVWHATGTVAVTAMAASNTGTSTTTNANVDIRSAQAAQGDVTAAANLTAGDAGYSATTATAAHNVGAISGENGQIRAIISQESNGAVSAQTEADVCCVASQAVAGAMASSNNVTVGGSTTTNLTDTRQVANGPSVTARADLYAGYATDAVANATANANAVTVSNEWGYTNARVRQEAQADVRADAYVTLGGDFLGFASAGAHGVGNTTTISNVGSNTDIDVVQNNAGDISANAATSGEGGEMALASAASYGNNVTASLCGYCDTNVPELRASNDQTNTGDVSATAVVNTPRARTVAATANAIGNAATFQTAGPTN